MTSKIELRTHFVTYLPGGILVVKNLFLTFSQSQSTLFLCERLQGTCCLGCAGCTICLGFLNETSRGAAVALLVLAMSFQNVTSIAFRINHLDIAPRFAGVMMGMTVTAAMGFSLTAPPITAAIIKDGREEEWMIVFIIVASLNIIGAVVFGAFASGQVQEWGLQANDSDYNIIPEVSSCDSDSFNDTSKTSSARG